MMRQFAGAARRGSAAITAIGPIPFRAPAQAWARAHEFAIAALPLRASRAMEMRMIPCSARRHQLILRSAAFDAGYAKIIAVSWLRACHWRALQTLSGVFPAFIHLNFEDKIYAQTYVHECYGRRGFSAAAVHA
jgi:hypothetical protein